MLLYATVHYTAVCYAMLNYTILLVQHITSLLYAGLGYATLLYKLTARQILSSKIIFDILARLFKIKWRILMPKNLGRVREKKRNITTLKKREY